MISRVVSRTDGYVRGFEMDESRYTAASDTDDDEPTETQKVRLEREMSLLEKDAEILAVRLKDWRARSDAIENELLEKRERLAEVQHQIEELCHPHRKVLSSLSRSGLSPLQKRVLFVESGWFTLLSSGIILLNLCTMAVEMVSHDERLRANLQDLNEAYLVFYLVELGLKGLLYRGRLLFGPCRDVWGNWIDILVVIGGIGELWIIPLLTAGNAGSHAVPVMSLLRMLRLLRLARVLKIVKNFYIADLSWTESDTFHVFMMRVIAFNTIILGLEADYDWGGFFYIEQVLLVIYTFELLARMKHHGMAFFQCKGDAAWNYMDLIVVCGGIMDQWMLPGISFMLDLCGLSNGDFTTSGNMGAVMSMLRIARLLRILRLIRLIKSVPELYSLAMGILESMRGMMWVLVLAFVVLYIFALLSVRLIRDGIIFGGKEHTPPEVEAIFPSIHQAVWVFFVVMNGDPTDLEPLFGAVPITQDIIMLFMVFSSWAILSILTAVVSENMIKTTERHRAEEEEKDEQLRWALHRKLLCDIFENADASKDGSLTKQEFLAWVEASDEPGKLEEMTGLQKDDLRQMFDYLCEEVEESTKGDDGEDIVVVHNIVRRDKFIEGLQKEGKHVRERSVMRLEKAVLEVRSMLVDFLRQEGAEIGSARATPAPSEPNSPGGPKRRLYGISKASL
mmetsp:Transcript_57649/g.137100  ORF Transcript_57649/g.137100 Transcript_57649/m.137100 type:complete len:678 (-) Transcript_57649:123-2156(-)|eukprot:CAMPEP_0178387716 /NCGR_PEP_ID=MMETSP0689_2-20121128/9216_1 /TAXON_ID=160604 /ORGANISM="Amphidinium massartii, Strain CS-259" /LENGTH=677 /DNA_ID=CAMNT_0020008087 /DNA_START=49 /DNA_END=2082 /DNA_ORIENTATION=+